MTKREMAFVLSLIATIISPVFLWFLFLRPPDIIGSIVLIMPIMITGLVFMRKRKSSAVGGVVILIMGVIIIGMLVLLPVEVETKMEYFLLIPAVMAMAGGYLGIQGAREGEVKKREYPKRFISGISTMGFIFALLSVFVFFCSLMVMGRLVGGWDVFAIFFVAIPLWVISIILNTISTVIVSKREGEITLEKRTIILIITTWCVIAFSLISLFFFLFLLFWLR